MEPDIGSHIKTAGWDRAIGRPRHGVNPRELTPSITVLKAAPMKARKSAL
jgi:hypothetical protein